MIGRLLRKNINLWQMGGYAIATLLGLLIVMTAVQFYRDVSPALSGDDTADNSISLSGTRNIVISKPVGLSATISGTTPSFSPDEIERLRRQPWAEAVQPFRAADFAVHAGLEMGGRGLSTALFFESVPDDVLDINPDDWCFDPASPSVPIILPKDYLTLYNFGFAASGRMPMLTEGMVGSVPLNITLSGRGSQTVLPGRIVGFSSTLNTVAVPESFMDWAHAQFGADDARDPSRLVITLRKEGDPGVAEYMKKYGYDIAGGDDDLGRTSFFVAMLVTVVAAVGGVITLLALGILVLSIYLLVQKNRKSISLLLLLGYTPSQVSGYYIRLVVWLDAAVALAGCLLLWVVVPLWHPALRALGIDPASLVPAMLLGMGLMAIITAINSLIIFRLVRRCF